ncbi:hypothetical protein [Aquibacillus albus]|uniref:Uncharacterized protein n=1 Tax=Aquibacillus albus TaxID=1168171 RepID=A0ABS2N0D8_9BACI|nr:hypothetical protein [Aquibacillus albus]MBM7571570.1 hypothetical protein [Aquibacillus albus]
MNRIIQELKLPGRNTKTFIIKRPNNSSNKKEMATIQLDLPIVLENNSED